MVCSTTSTDMAVVGNGKPDPAPGALLLPLRSSTLDQIPTSPHATNRAFWTAHNLGARGPPTNVALGGTESLEAASNSWPVRERWCLLCLVFITSAPAGLNYAHTHQVPVLLQHPRGHGVVVIF